MSRSRIFVVSGISVGLPGALASFEMSPMPESQLSMSVPEFATSIAWALFERSSERDSWEFSEFQHPDQLGGSKQPAKFGFSDQEIIVADSQKDAQYDQHRKIDRLHADGNFCVYAKASPRKLTESRSMFKGWFGVTRYDYKPSARWKACKVYLKIDLNVEERKKEIQKNISSFKPKKKEIHKTIEIKELSKFKPNVIALGKLLLHGQGSALKYMDEHTRNQSWDGQKGLSHGFSKLLHGSASLQDVISAIVNDLKDGNVFFKIRSAAKYYSSSTDVFAGNLDISTFTLADSQKIARAVYELMGGRTN